MTQRYLQECTQIKMLTHWEFLQQLKSCSCCSSGSRMILMLLPQSKSSEKSYRLLTQTHNKRLRFTTHFKPSVIKNLANHLLGVYLIISHKYLLFAVNCTKAKAPVLMLNQLLVSTVSVLFPLLQHQQQHSMGL